MNLSLTEIVVCATLISTFVIALIYLAWHFFKKPNYRMIVSRLYDHKWFMPQIRYKGDWYTIIYSPNHQGTIPHISLNRDSAFFYESDCARNITDFHNYLKENPNIKIINDREIPVRELSVNHEIRNIHLD